MQIHQDKMKYVVHQDFKQHINEDMLIKTIKIRRFVISKYP